MKDINKLIEITKDLKLNDIEAELIFIQQRLANKNSEIIVPVVGEFSSGKTTLINALTDNKQLETASIATTSVIYEIFFNKDKQKALIYHNNQTIEETSDIAAIKNKALGDVDLIQIFDTSNKIDPQVVIVDTPGLSSNESKHLENLSRYLPKADALIICIDANQQITNTLLDFIRVNQLMNLDLFLVITKSDTKTEKEIESIKQHIMQNINYPLKKIVSVSSLNDDLVGFYDIIKNLQNNRNAIIESVVKQQLMVITKYIKEFISQLISTTNSDQTIGDRLKEENNKLQRLNSFINGIIEDARDEISKTKDKTIHTFKINVNKRLDTIISTRTDNIDTQAYNAVSMVSNLILDSYKSEVQNKILQIGSNKNRKNPGIDLRFLENIEIGQYQMDSLSYNVNLHEAGQEITNNISKGIKVVGTVAAVAAITVATAGIGGAAAGAATTATAAEAGALSGAVTGTAASVGAKVIGKEVAKKAATEVSKATLMTMFSNKGKALWNDLKDDINNVDFEKIKKKGEFLSKHYTEQQQNIETKSDGFLEKVINTIGDSMIGKPQRQRIIEDYIHSTLLSEFTHNLDQISNDICNTIKQLLNAEANNNFEQLNTSIVEMRQLYINDEEKHQELIKKYKNYLTILNN